MTTYWLLGEKEQVASLSTIVGSQDEQNMPQSELTAPLSISTCITEVVPETLKKTHFNDNASEIDAENMDVSNRSSKTNNPSDSRTSKPSSSHSSQPSAHVFSNPMTSIIIMDDENTEQSNSQATANQQQTSSLG